MTRTMANARRVCALMGTGVAAIWLALAASAAWAAPEDDYQTGRKAYESGDFFAAMPPLRRAADAGHAAAQASYASLLEASGAFPEAFEYFRKSAEQGHAEGQFGYGVTLSEGRSTKPDPVAARGWIAKAASQGLPAAINALAGAYIAGGLGVPKGQVPDAEGVGWIQKAAAGNHLLSVDYLGKAYRTGLFGEIDLDRAKQYEAQAEKLRYPSGRPSERRRR